MSVCGSHSIYYRVHSGYVEIRRVILSTLLLAALIQAAVRDRREASCGDKGKWARIAERIVRAAPLDEECAAILREASWEFHEDFAFKRDLDPAEK